MNYKKQVAEIMADAKLSNYEQTRKKLQDLFADTDFTFPSDFYGLENRKAVVTMIYQSPHASDTLPFGFGFNVYKKRGGGYLDRTPSLLRSILSLERLITWL